MFGYVHYAMDHFHGLDDVGMVRQFVIFVALVLLAAICSLGVSSWEHCSTRFDRVLWCNVGRRDKSMYPRSARRTIHLGGVVRQMDGKSRRGWTVESIGTLGSCVCFLALDRRSGLVFIFLRRIWHHETELG